LKFAAGFNAPAHVEIQRVSAQDVPKDGLRITTTSKQNANIAKSADQSASDHNSGKEQYNM
jgi:hypothetical protein